MPQYDEKFCKAYLKDTNKIFWVELSLESKIQFYFDTYQNNLKYMDRLYDVEYFFVSLYLEWFSKLK